MSRRLPYEPALDGLRGLAVLAVVVFHALPLALPGGFLGVDIFFVLSGYLITNLLLLEHKKTNRIDVRQFYTRRWFRLGPALLVMLTLYGLTVWLFSPEATLKNQGTDILLTLLYLTNWGRALLLKESTDLGHTWSLAVEEQFYIVWPLLLWFIMRAVGRNRALVSVIVILAVASWATRQWLFHDGAVIARIYNGLDTRVESIMWGAVLAAWMNLKTGHLPTRKWTGQLPALAWISLLGILLMFAKADWTSDWYYQYGLTLVAIFSVLMIQHLHSSENSLMKQVFSHPWLVWLGTVSYGLYLWHFPIYKLLLSFDIEDWQLLVLGGMMTVPVAAMSYYGLERPLLKSHK